MMGDVDHDNDVDNADAAAVTAALGTHPGETGWNAAADLNNDQAITSADQDLVTSNLGRSLEESEYGMMPGQGEAGLMAGTMDGSIPTATKPVDSYGLTFEQALQSVGLLDEWLEYKATQQGQ